MSLRIGFLLCIILHFLRAACEEPTDNTLSVQSARPSSSGVVTPESESPPATTSSDEPGTNLESHVTSVSSTPAPARISDASHPNEDAMVKSSTGSESPSALSVEHPMVPSPVIGQVFVPLKEWKQRKLEDIESMARRIQTPIVDSHESIDVTRTMGGSAGRRDYYQHNSVAWDSACMLESNAILFQLGVVLGQCSVDSLSPYSTMYEEAPLSPDVVAQTGGANEDYSDCQKVPIEGTTNSADTGTMPSADDKEHASGPIQQHINSPEQLETEESTKESVKNSPQRFVHPSDPAIATDRAPGRQPDIMTDNASSVRNVSGLRQSEQKDDLSSNLLLEKLWHKGSTDAVFSMSVTDFMRSMWAASLGFRKRSAQFGRIDSALSSSGTSGTSNSSPVSSGMKADGSNGLNETFDSADNETEMSLSEVLGNASSQPSGALVKERPFNFASADAGARILSYSEGIVGAKNVIEASVDKYSLAPCQGAGVGGSRWIDIELSEDVILESVEVANFEYYSSSARRIAVLGAGSYPAERWNTLGIFDFADVRTTQRFQIQKRVVTRFLRVMFAGKQGHEYYCPVTTIRAFGKNLIADWKDVFEEPGKNNKNEKDRNGFRKETGGRAKEVAQREEVAKSVSSDKVAGYVKQEVEEKNVGTCSGSTCGEKNGSPGSTDGNVEEKRSNGSVEESGGSTGDNAETVPQKDGVKEAADEHGGSTENMGENDGISEEDQIVLDAVRANALSTGSGDENIFRKVTRMLRLLELNQTLTNQYIDTHLAGFADALSNVQLDSAKTQSSALRTERKLAHVVSTLEATVQELKSAAFKRDIVMCLLVICIAFLLGTHWVLWTAVSGTRLHESTSEYEINDIVARSEHLQLPRRGINVLEQDGQNDADDHSSNRNVNERRKSIGDANHMHVARLENMRVNFRRTHERSISSIDLSSVSAAHAKAPGNVD